MTLIGYHASHEQFTPGDLVEHVVRAEEAGFGGAMCSDHFHPWSQAQGQSGHAWVWLGAAMARTRFPFGVVNAPVGRYHPIVIAQAVATLGCLFGDRFWLAVGSGEALNEWAAGDDWPPKDVRNARLQDAVDVMRTLWRGERVSHDGHFAVREAALYSRPAHAPKVFVAALTPDTARWAATWADGLITVAAPAAPVAEVIQAFRTGGGQGKPVSLQVKLSYARHEEEALQGALDQWRTNALPPEKTEALRTPEAFERAARDVGEAEIRKAVHVSARLDDHLNALRGYLDLEIDAMYLHNVNRDQQAFIDAFGRHVLPALE